MASSIRPDEAPIDHKPLVDNIQQLFASSEYSDLKIVCEGKIWNVHRNIVCTACPFLKLRCQNFQDVRTTVIHLSHDRKSAVQALLSYIYTADYKTDDSMDSEAMVFQVRVHTIANKYGLSKLSALAEFKFLAIAKGSWASSGFATAIEEMYTVTPDTKKELQYIAIRIAVEHVDVLLGDEWSSLARLSRRLPAFAFDLSRELMARKAKKTDGTEKKSNEKHEKRTEKKTESTEARTEDQFMSIETKTESKSRSTASRSKKPESIQTWTENQIKSTETKTANNSRSTEKSTEKKAKSPEKKASGGRRCSKCGSSRLYRVHESLFQRAGIWCKSCGKFRS
ncbi:hypothetical protein CBER1_11332 [Cercospora berteroae]|uniref:BTB domain-containing protein n=1 Tax=Cercospora berteroae TaxID=357750 RepID=A0A2S6BZW1_9PEZI|nr:hypothetical protein CBER1_11332 [Cercospora berteroae]